jgi:hypothetical protein
VERVALDESRKFDKAMDQASQDPEDEPHTMVEKAAGLRSLVFDLRPKETSP